MLHRRLSAITVIMLTVHLGVSAGNAQTVTVTFQEGVAGYAACVDTTLDEAAPDTPFGDGPTVVVDGNCGVPCSCSCRNDGLLRFDGIFGNGANQIPIGSIIASAELTVNVVPTGADNVTTTLHRILVPWTEDVTWNNSFGGNGIDADDNEAPAAVEATLLAPYGVGPLEIEVTTSVQAWSAGEPNHGWVFLPGNDGNFGWAFSSCDSGTPSIRPKLEVTFEPIDSDNDGVPDDEDNCLNSDLAESIMIDDCDTGVENELLEDGCTMADLIAQCADGVETHGAFVRCVAHLTNFWKCSGLISGGDKGHTQSCVGQADIP